MNKKSEIIYLIKEQKILPLYFHEDEIVSIEVFTRRLVSDQRQ